MINLYERDSTMLKAHKIAIVRIFSDLIKADRIIDTGEMECWTRICGKYSIDREAQIEAQNISFAQALDDICSSGGAGLQEDLLGDCRSMAVSDGFCAHSEALIMIALTLMLQPNRPFRVEAISIPKASFNIDVATALYIENDFDEGVNSAIIDNYRTIFKEFQIAGFHFVYPPNIINHYRDTDVALFKRILSFLSPSVSEEGLDSIYRSLMKMTTATFCKDLLCNKCGISELRNTYPSLLIKIGNSFVGEVKYANYLKIEVDEEILTTVRSFIDRFCDMLSSDMYVVNTSEERDNQFHFHGFYRQLLEIFLIRKNIRSTIVIDPYKDEILFPELDAKASGVHRREKALYALLLCYGREGIDFTMPRTSDGMARYNRRLKRIQARYAAIYAMFGGDREAAPDLGVPEIRRPIFSCLKRSLGKLKALYNPEDYNISKDANGVFSVHVDPELVYVTPLRGFEPVALKDSELFIRWARE